MSHYNESEKELTKMYDKVEAIFDKDSVCHTCKFYTETHQSHPYGSTTATEVLRGCRILEESLNPQLCPGV